MLYYSGAQISPRLQMGKWALMLNQMLYYSGAQPQQSSNFTPTPDASEGSDAAPDAQPK